MISLARLVLDRAEAGKPPTRAELEAVPASQYEIYFEELSRICPSRMALGIPRRPANALNVEIGQPMNRCKERSPDGRGAIWLLSGGSPLAYGLCACAGCPRTRGAK